MQYYKTKSILENSDRILKRRIIYMKRKSFIFKHNFSIVLFLLIIEVKIK